MKRVLLIAGGTTCGLGAVLAITPPQLNSANTELALPSAGASAATASATPTATSAPATSAPKASATKKATSTPKESTAPSTSKTPAPTQTASSPAAATPTTAAPAPSAAKPAGVTGTFTGDPIFVNYGTVQVRITVSNGKITDAQAIQAPSGRNDRWTNMSVPVLRERTLAAQGSNISGVSGASYTSYGWYKSLVSALSKAGI